MLVYKITNTVNGKVYIGQTVGTLHKRWSAHKTDARNGKKSLTICKAIRKYGPENFCAEELATASSIEMLNELEIHFINLYRSHDPKFGYNSTFGGDRPKITEQLREKFRSRPNHWKRRKHSSETIERMADAQRGPKNHRFGKQGARGPEHPGFGKKASTATRDKLRAAAAKRKADGKVRPPCSEETKQKIGKANKGRVKTQEEIDQRRAKILGRPRLEETKQKIRDSNKARVAEGVFLHRKGKSMTSEAINKLKESQRKRWAAMPTNQRETISRNARQKRFEQLGIAPPLVEATSKCLI